MENSKSFKRDPQAKRIIVFTLFLVSIVFALLVYDGIINNKFLNILVAPLFFLVPLAEIYFAGLFDKLQNTKFSTNY